MLVLRNVEIRAELNCKQLVDFEGQERREESSRWSGAKSCAKNNKARPPSQTRGFGEPLPCPPVPPYLGMPRKQLVYKFKGRLNTFHCMYRVSDRITPIDLWHLIDHFTRASVLAIDCECSGLRDEILVHRNILTRLLSVPALLDTTEW